MTAKAEKIESLYAAEHQRLERQIRRKIGCSATACDLVQDIFLRIWEKAGEPSGNSAAYLTRSARNAAIDHVRSEKRRARFFEAILPEQYAPPQPTPLDVAIARQGIRSLDDALSGLPKQTRHIFLLNRVHGRTFVEIAGAMGISERAVAKHMARAVALCERLSAEVG
jgi:RNA polymerase sigma-70 factor (ECF subfamily)